VKLAVPLLALLVACSPAPRAQPPDVDAPLPMIDAPEAFPLLRRPVDLPDLALAKAAAARLGVGTAKACDQCHSLTRGTLTRWLDESRVAEQCLTNLVPLTGAEARGMVECFRGKTTDYDPKRLGIYATAASLAWFTEVVTMSGADRDDWTARVQMPRGGQSLLSQDEFDIVAEWFARGLPRMDAVVSDVTPVMQCVDHVGPEVATHLAAMATQGWTAVNRTDGLAMFGCGASTDPLQCLTSAPLAPAAWRTAAPEAVMRVLYTYNYNSAFWTRSSADGRFVAHGRGGGAAVIDLQTNRVIDADALYDPGFFPDNSGFVIQGGSKAWCRQSLLTSNPASITFTEAECSDVSTVGLYQHVGAVHNADYWAVAGQFVSDDAWGEPSSDFGQSTRAQLTPMLWDGTRYIPKPNIEVPTPYEGDTIISASAKLMLSRTSFNGAQAGFTLRAINATPSGGSYTVTAPVIGQYCASGGKPAFSYDDKWLAYHHWIQPDDWSSLGYASATDPQFTARLNAGTANIFVIDLSNGIVHRITNMNAGQVAVFPHFRSDGWIYFVVKDQATPNQERVVASDAALHY